ncbi:MAG: carbohydrate kinase family protein [Armatimonadota bacterium]
MAQVTCLGILVADLIGKPVDKFPERGQLTLVDQMELHLGGCAANTGVDLAKIGIETAIVGKVGADGLGDFVVRTLENEGISAGAVVRDASIGTSGTMVMVHGDGERSFIHYLGANAALTEEDIDFEMIRGSEILHVAGTFLMPGIDGEPTARVLAKAKEMGITTSLDTAWDSKGRWMELIAPCLPYTDYFVPSIEEARLIAGKHDPADVAKVFLDAGVKVVGLKMGSEGCYIRTADQEVRAPIYRVNAVDACGAGDSFAAGFLAGMVRGWDLEKTGRFANAVGAHCVMAMGATTGIKSEAEILAFMENYA